jgi:hypothetical protein
MNGSEALMQGMPAPAQGRVCDARVRGEQAAGPSAGSDDRAFDELYSNLADGVEAGDGGSTSEPGARDSARLQVLASVSILNLGVGEAQSSFGEQEPAADPGTGSETADALQAALLAASVPQPADALSAALAGAMALAGPPIVAATQGGVDDGTKVGALAGMTGLATDPEPLDLNSQIAFSGGGRGTPSAAFTEVIVSVLAQETHFAPVPTSAKALDLIAGAAVSAASSRQSGFSASEDGALKGTNAALLADDRAHAATGPLAPLAAGEGAGSGPEEGTSHDRRRSENSLNGPSADQQTSRDPARSMEFLVSGAQGPEALSTSGAATGAQVARRIVAELGDATGVASASTASAGQEPGSHVGMLRVLHIQLEPANLGVVTVRVALKDNVISLHVEASRLETAVAIEKDRETLSSALKSAGYLVDGITAQPSDTQRASVQVQTSATDAQSSLQSQSGSQSGLPHSRGQSGGQEPRDAPEQGYRPAAGVNESRGGASQVGSGALYV